MVFWMAMTGLGVQGLLLGVLWAALRVGAQVDSEEAAEVAALTRAGPPPKRRLRTLRAA